MATEVEMIADYHRGVIWLAAIRESVHCTVAEKLKVHYGFKKHITTS